MGTRRWPLRFSMPNVAEIFGIVASPTVVGPVFHMLPQMANIFELGRQEKLKAGLAA